LQETETRARFEWTDYSFARAGAYIVDWSIAHEADAADRMPPKRASYEALRPEVFEVIDNALGKGKGTPPISTGNTSDDDPLGLR